MGGDHADVSKHVKMYIAVFVALAVFTVLTVAASLIHVSTGLHITIALVIATVKAALVGWVFMHLKWDRMISIWWVLGLCAACFVVLMLVPVLSVNDDPPGVRHATWSQVEAPPPTPRPSRKRRRCRPAARRRCRTS